MGNFMNFWDQQFSVPDFRYGQQPNRFLCQQAVRLKPQSRALLPADGEGRNGAKRRHPLHVVHADLAQWTPEPASCDAIVLTCDLPADLRPGGLFIRCSLGARAVAPKHRPCLTRYIARRTSTLENS